MSDGPPRKGRSGYRRGKRTARRPGGEHGDRTALDRHDPHPVDGCGTEGERRAPRHGDGARAARLSPLHGGTTAQPGEPALARSRPVRAQCRPRVHPAVLGAAPGRLRPLDRGSAELPPVGFEDARPSRVRAHRRASRRRRGRSARASRTASGWGSPSASSPTPSTARCTRSSTTASTSICSDGDLMEGCRTRPSRSPGRSRSASSSTSTTTTTSRSTAPRRSRFRPRTRAPGSRRRAGTSSTSTTSTISTRSARRSRQRTIVTDRPSLVVVRSHIAYGAPHAVDTSKAHGAPLGEPEVRATKEALGWDPDAHFVVPPRSTST